MKFSPLINVKMPTIDGIFTCRGGKNNILGLTEPYKGRIDLFHIVSAHAYIGLMVRYFPIIGETLQRWGKRILSH